MLDYLIEIRAAARPGADSGEVASARRRLTSRRLSVKSGHSQVSFIHRFVPSEDTPPPPPPAVEPPSLCPHLPKNLCAAAGHAFSGDLEPI